jgi:hypothetical protein
LSRMNGEASRRRHAVTRRCGLAPLALVALFGCAAGTASAAPQASRIVHYHGDTIVVPAAWPVYNLSADPAVCVRFNRHAVYLGSPSAQQRCPAHAVGRTEAILVAPMAARDSAFTGGRGFALSPSGRLGAQPPQGSVIQVPVSSHGLLVTATWGSRPGLLERALGLRSLATVAAARASGRPARAVETASSRPPAAPGAVYTGLGFDACSAPTPGQMSSWTSSPYDAAGIYIGGTNMGCSQPNLTAAWVAQESAAGWHLIPTYVGLQAPSNSCGCGAIVPSLASKEGTAAATDALTQAGALGIGTGNPIYFDLEAYTPGASSTPAVLTFLSAWTAYLHAHAYKSGVYSSGASGIRDLVNQWGTVYREPDDLWIADWNGAQTTSDPYVPSADWPVHQRLHQYNGGHDATYSGVTINIDGDYLDGATAAVGSAGGPPPPPPPFPPPKLTVSPGVDGSIHLHASWAGATGVQAWRVLAGDSPSALVSLAGAAQATTQIALTVKDTLPYFAMQALGAGEQVLATTPPVATPPHIAIYGPSVFSPAYGLASAPVGCFTGSLCRVTLTITAGHKLVARTGPESVPAGGGGLVFFRVSSAGRSLLRQRSGHAFPVLITVHDASGTSAAATLNLVPYLTSGRGPRRSVGPSSTVRVLGMTAFVGGGGVGGVLAACSSDAPCVVRTTITAGGARIASTGPELLGAHQLGYLIFGLTRQGRAALARQRGNQLGAHVLLTGASIPAGASIALVHDG